MKKKFLLFFFFISIGINAQKAIHPVFCGNEVFSNLAREKYPALYEAFNSTFEAAHTSHRFPGNEPLTVNVVVHVIWKEEEENLNDIIIENQIRILNDDYNRLNADSANLRPIFIAEAGTVNIHFELAQIVRVNTDQEFNVDFLGTNLLAEAKHTADGGIQKPFLSVV